MYKCSKCDNPITEFDANFEKCLSGNLIENKCKCAQCIANVDGLEILQKSKQKRIFYLLPYMIIAIITAVCLFMNNNAYKMDIDILFNLFGDNEWLCEAFFPIVGLFTLFLIMQILTGYIWAIIIVMGDLGFKDEDGYDVNVYKTTYDSSSNSFSTTTEKENVGGGPSSAAFF